MRTYLSKGWLLLLCVVPTGCATLQEWNESVISFTREPPLALVTRMDRLEDREDRDQLAASVLTRYEDNPDDGNRLRLAIVRSLPGHELHDDKEALVLLNSLSQDRLSKSEQRVSSWLDKNLQEQIALRELVSDLRGDLQSVEGALDKAREKIEILTRIERTMGPNSESNQ